MTMNDKKTPKNAKKIVCILCDFKCSKQSDYKRHLLTRKHQNNEKRMTLDDKKTPKNANNFECVCGKKYMYRQGLWNHHKRCNISSTNDTVSEIKQIDGLHKSDIKIDKDLVMSDFQLFLNIHTPGFLRSGGFFSSESFFHFSKLDKNKCPILGFPEKDLEKNSKSHIRA